MTASLGRFWLDITWHPGRRWCDLHGVRGGGGASFTCDLGPLGIQGGIEARS